ncbi:MAG: hypothetical protein DDT19_00820 [Syntrophomonadaceae bacterium]|nr:hypothetical protein [Bacillota bacterium]
MNTIQIQQIMTFLSAYPKDVAEAGIKAWREGEIEGIVSDIPLAQHYSELTDEAKQFVIEESKKMQDIMPFCECGRQLALVGVCPGCPRGAEGYRTKFVCSCGYEEFFKETIQDKVNELMKGGM